MVNINSIHTVVYDTEQKKFGFNYSFSSGLNIISGDNSSGKSTILSCIYYCLGMEQLISYGTGDGLKECLKRSFTFDERDYTVFSSYAVLTLTSSEGISAKITRVIKAAYDESPNVLNVSENDGPETTKFIHSEGDTDHKDGFYTWLSNFAGLTIPVFEDDEGNVSKILYLQQILASSFVEQTKGWSDFFAQVPVFATKKAKQKIIEYSLGLNGLVEEFEFERLTYFTRTEI